MKSEYDLANIKSRPNPFAQQLKLQVTLPLRIDTKSVEYRLVMRRGTHARGKRQRGK